MQEELKHDDCLRKAEWGELREFMRNMTSSLELIRRENKELTSALLDRFVMEKRDREALAEAIDERITRHKAERTIGLSLMEAKIERLQGKIEGILIWTITSIIAFAIAWGALTTTVMRNTSIINELQKPHVVKVP